MASHFGHRRDLPYARRGRGGRRGGGRRYRPRGGIGLEGKIGIGMSERRLRFPFHALPNVENTKLCLETSV